MTTARIRCTGRAVDDHLRPVGPTCTNTYKPRGHVLDSQSPERWRRHTEAEQQQMARAAGWSFAPQADGTTLATCPRCRRPDPATTEAIIQKGLTHP